MDASELRSAISELRSECSQLERENAEMQREINAIISSAQSATMSLTRSCRSATATLDNSANVIGYSEEVMDAVSAEQENIAALYRGFKNIETANKKIRELNNKIYFEFSNFRMVRKIVRAFVDNINLEMVKPEMIYKAVEKEHLQAPDFWLSAAMLAIMHWTHDERAAADRALKQALELDERQTVLFFMSFNLLLGRKEVALKWFECYERIESTGRDANVMLLLLHSANLREEADSPLTKRIMAYLRREFDKSKRMNDWNEAVAYVKERIAQSKALEPMIFEYLRNYAKDYSTMASVLNRARGNGGILEFVERNNTVTRDKGYIFIEKFISELLDTPDKKERAYTDEIAYNEAIIHCVGDLAAADAEYREMHQREVDPLNLMAECINWLFSNTDQPLSDVARSNMFLLCRPIIEDAIEEYVEGYRAAVKDVHPVAIKDYGTQMDFRRKENEMTKVSQYYENKKKTQLAAVKNTAIVVSLVLAALLLVGGVVCLVMEAIKHQSFWSVLCVICVIAAVCLGIKALATHFGNKKKRKQIIESNDAALAHAREIIEKLFEEYVRYTAVYAENDRIVDDIEFAVMR